MPLGYSNSVQYRLYSERKGFVDIPEPINFEDGNGNIYERDKESKGVLQVKSNTLELFGAAYKFLLTHNFLDGLDDVRILKMVKSADRLDEQWRVSWEAFIDAGSLEFNEDREVVKVKFAQGGLASLIDSRKTDDYDLINTTSVDGKDIGVFNTVDLALKPRRIFLRSKLEDQFEQDFWANMPRFDSGEYRTGNKGLPLEIINKSDERVQSVLSSNLDGYAADQNGQVSDIIYLNNDRPKTQRVKLDYTFKIGAVDNDRSAQEQFRIYFRRYKNGEDLVLDSEQELLEVTYPQNYVGQTYNVTFDQTIDLDTGDSWAFVVQVAGNIGTGSPLNQSGVLAVRMDDREGSLVIEEDSEFPATSCKAVTAFEMFDRIMAQITGEHGRFKSNLFGNGGKLENDLLTVGWWIRNFPDVINKGTDEERRIQFKTSFEKAFNSFDAQLPLCWFVKREGNKEYLHIEELKYSQQNKVTIKYGKTTANGFQYLEPYKATRSVLADNYYSAIEIGSKQGGNGYEEVFGLQSVCGNAQFETINRNKKSKYTKLSEYAHGDVDVEIPRRYQYDTYPETDTQYDDVICVVKAKKVGSSYTPKLWPDTYSVAPKNIYDPATAYNLELTPAQLLINHGYVLMPGLVHRPVANIRWISSNCNSSLITQKSGEDELREDGFIKHDRLGKPRIRPRVIDFNLPVSQELEDMINSGDQIANWYGLVEVKIKGNIEYFRLVKVDTNKEGKHKLVEAYI